MRRIPLILTFLLLAPLVRAKEALPFIENDWTKAAAQAKAKHLPMFVDAWAPW